MEYLNVIYLYLLSINGTYSFKNKEKELTKKGFPREAFQYG